MKKIAFCLALLCASSMPAFAHVTANPNAGKAGQYFETKFRVSHGCEGSDTVSISIKLPPGFVTLKPQHKEGWQVDVKKSKLDKPVPAGHGKMATEQFEEITWRGGKLPDAEYDEFGLLIKLPEGAGILWFPVKQVCEKGEANWQNVPANLDLWHKADHPAPYIKVESADKPAHQH